MLPITPPHAYTSVLDSRIPVLGVPAPSSPIYWGKAVGARAAPEKFYAPSVHPRTPSLLSGQGTLCVPPPKAMRKSYIYTANH